LSKAFALAVPHDSALEIRDEVGFFQEIRAVLAKIISDGGGKSPEELELPSSITSNPNLTSRPHK
jgi:type I restriction enzyme R subunit